MVSTVFKYLLNYYFATLLNFRTEKGRGVIENKSKLCRVLSLKDTDTLYEDESRIIRDLLISE